MGMGASMKIGEFAKMTGVPSHTLRRLDSAGKLVPMHSNVGHRRYDVSQVSEAEQYVRRMKLLDGGKNIVREMADLDDFFAYLLGMVMADGTVLESGQVQLELKDKQVLEDIAEILGAEIHPRPDRPMWRMTVPRPVANHLVEYGVCRRKCEGFDIPEMSERSFGCFLRGLFDGDGSVSIRGNRTILRFHGHPKAMAHVQATLLSHFGLYMAWVPDNRIESGMLEIGNHLVVGAICSIMYGVNGIHLVRKKQCLVKKEDTNMGMG
jgi:DNA-binding transcriptional MerR regulator